ncbi:aquaporin [Sedimentibacter sp. zth1]|uniref:MIP/aquaporin family protein n=1 Tax=Sedimentibacter sp. zth1 TaxID=2816908 RepID=UPI001A9121EE|nr:MIP/aquaporin family protein [Sedimentibacter sp. zth1]QSX05637.1 aquaporin [Sedimentibacter sp. zth1]
MKKYEFKKYIAEFIGTFILVFNGTGAIIINDLSNEAVTHLGISLAFGFTVAFLIYTFGNVSGAHFNPAVSIALWKGKEINTKHLLFYIVSQLGGAITASLILIGIFGNIAKLGTTQPLQSLGNNAVLISLIVEIIYTFILMIVILGSAVDKRAHQKFAGIAIGFTIAIGVLIIGPISGGSFNPARSIGPAIISGNLNYLWVYIVGPIIGTLLATYTYKLIKE